MKYWLEFDHGNPYYMDMETGEMFWLSDGKPYDYKNPRPCARCGREVAFGKPDPCIGEIPLVCGACCGHGVEDPMVFNGSIKSEAQGMYSWYKFAGNQDGGFGRGIQMGDVTKYDALYRLYDKTFISRYPIHVGPMDIPTCGKPMDEYAFSILNEEIRDLQYELGLYLNCGSAIEVKLSLPSRNDMIAAYKAADLNKSYFQPCWTKTYLHGVPLCAHQWTFDYATHMEELNVYPLITTDFLSIMGAVNQFILEHKLHDDKIIRDDD